MPQIGPAEILVILLVGLLVFGPKRLPEIGRQVGRGMRELKKFQDTVKGELDQVMSFHDDDTDHLGYSPPEAPITNGDTPALPAASGFTAPASPAGPASRAPSRFRAPGPEAVRPASRAPSRFRAPGPRPTT